MSLDQPLVSVVTPVYNGEVYLRECIESVIAQTYDNYEYIIVDNCSTDRTAEIARSFAQRDKRIRIMRNQVFVRCDENHNIAFRHISPQSKYCKVVSADDWIYPECLSKLVGLAEKHPELGIVGSYGITDKGIRWMGLPPEREIFDGREASRLYLLGELDFFGMPSGVLYRSDLVRSIECFYPGLQENGDVLATLKCLQTSDLGFVHQILYYERVHEQAITSKLRAMQGLLSHPLQFLQEFGHVFLTPEELKTRRDAVLSRYYRVLATEIINFKGPEFINHHRSVLNELGYRLFSTRLLAAVGMKILGLALNPMETTAKLLRRLRNRWLAAGMAD